MYKNKLIWIAWENHRRTQELCSFLEITPVIMCSELTRLIKHPLFMIKTIICLAKRKPSVLIVQNPSVLLTVETILLRKIFRYKLIVDSHNSGILPCKGISRKAVFIYRWIQRKADLTIVTNSYLANVIKKNGGIYFILPDKIPACPEVKSSLLKRKFNIVCISTFSSDEPYEEIIKASAYLDDESILYITGNYNRIKNFIAGRNLKNIIFTGYLPEEKYWSLLTSANIIMDLTNREDCLVCGAYEAVAAEKPMILSNTNALRLQFYKGVVYTQNTVEHIMKSIEIAKCNEGKLSIDVKKLKRELDFSWYKSGNELKEYVYGSSGGPGELDRNVCF
jgi:glycosyltransferase involved in cell wall biosynthesis